jgi:hypothetical protein
MNEYLSYQLWRQREERMPHELEHQRVVQERLLEQEQQLQHEQELAATQPDVAEANVLSADEYVLVDE